MNPETRLHATFLYHCALAPSAHDPSVHVLLAPSEVGMEHVAGLRIPVEFIVQDHTGFGDDQETEWLDGQQLTTTRDRTWRLEGYDVKIDPPARGATPERPYLKLFDPAPEAPAPLHQHVSKSADGGSPVPRAIASIDHLTMSRLDSACLEHDPPKPLWAGARVRVWGGTLSCGVPDRELDNRKWEVGTFDLVTRLSDRIEFEKPISGDVVLTFRKFGEAEERRLVLRPLPGVNETVRFYVSNDPKPLSGSHGHAGSHETPSDDPCSQLPHFPSYSFLLRPVGPKNEGLPSPMPRGFVKDPPHRGFLVLEGDTVCCPCTYGTPGS